MQFVGTDGNQIGMKGMNGFQRLFSKPLNGVGMEQDTLIPTKSANFSDGLEGANFVVSCHDGNQLGIWPDGFTDRFGIYPALVVHRKIRDLEAFLRG